jgi:putative salt-induced outer membrane protein YdiY
MNCDRLSGLPTVGALVLSTVLGSASAFAQELPPGLQKRAAATSGREDVAVTGFATATAKPEENKDATELKLSAGGLFSGGNSESLALTTSSKLRLRRGDDQFELAVAGNYGEAAPPGEDEREANVENLQGRVRYDRFLVEGLAVFLSTSAVRDRFQGLDLRLNIDPGFAYYFLDADKQRFWTELGYDLQYDYRREDAVEAAMATGSPIDRSETRHGARAFVGYTSELAEGVAFDSSVEYLQALKETKNWRLGCDIGLTAALKGGFSLATTFSLRYDNNPLADVETTDMASALSLVYQLL